MENQKLENLLNLAIDASEEERERSQILEVGYNPIDREWDLIIKYSGNLEEVRELASRVTELLSEYAVITIRESLIDRLAELPQVEYVEKPKRLYFQAANGRRVSCIDSVQGTRFELYGQGTLVAVIDSGIDYTLPDFRNADGSTRIRYLWDQSIPGEALGAEYSAEQINEALQAQTRNCGVNWCRVWIPPGMGRQWRELRPEMGGAALLEQIPKDSGLEPMRVLLLKAS